MPGRLRVRILAGRHLPIMDRASDLTDAFVEIKFGSATYKTEVYAKSLNPHWNSEWFKFEADDEQLQDEPLQIRILDHDTYSAHDTIGKVYIDVDPLLDPDSSHQLGGWFPIFDTMHGIRGEILLMVKLELFADINQFKQSSCGFKFICGTRLPHCYKIKQVHEFVCDLLVCEDPEYKWIEKLRTPRASNEARQRLFSKMSGELQRRIGSKVENIGGNAVIGYHQSYDMEGDSGIVIRGIGTAVTIEKLKKPCKTQLSIDADKPADKVSQFATTTSLDHVTMNIERGSIDVLPHKFMLNEFPFYTLTSFPRGVLVRLSIIVCARSVKLLEKIHSQEDHETREIWWNELRQEIKSHCLFLSCNAVIGYTEQTTICDDVIVLSCQGSAAVINPMIFASQLQGSDKEIDGLPPHCNASPESEQNKIDSSHIYDCTFLFQVSFEVNEQISWMKYQPSPLNPSITVPDVLLTTVDLPMYVHCIGKGTLVQARFCRMKKKCQSENSATVVTDILPFIEYELHKRLYNKIKIRGMNALFGYRSTITLGENLLVGVATGTAVCLAALPIPAMITSDGTEQSSLHSANEEKERYINICKEKFHLHQYKAEGHKPAMIPASSESQHPASTLPDKRSLFVEMEEMVDENAESTSFFREPLPPPHCYYSNLDVCPGTEGRFELIQAFSCLWRVRYDDDLDDEALNRGLSSSFLRVLNSLWFRIRRRNPVCILTSLRFHVAIPDDDELQIWISGSVLAPGGGSSSEKGSVCSKRSSLMIHHNLPSPRRVSSSDRQSSDVELDSVNLSLDERRQSPNYIPKPLSPLLRRLRRTTISSGRSRYDSTSSSRIRHWSEDSSVSDLDFNEINKTAGTVELSTMSFIPGRIIRYHFGVLNVFIIRETTAVRGADDMIPMAEPSNGTGCSWFVARTLAETQAIIRAHVVALGGNALLSYRSSYLTFKESLTKNEAQCLLHVIGDVVEVTSV